MRRIDLAALEIFRQVALEGSISGAALKLNRVQSNVSTRVKLLEERLGTTLFEREPRGLTLTESGQTLLTYADRLISLSEEAVDALTATEPSGPFRIGTMESTAASRLPEFLSRYHGLYPNVTIHLETDTAGGLTRRLCSNELDVAFVAEPIATEGLVWEAVFEEQLLLVAPVSFPPLRHAKEISGKTIIAFEEGCAYRRYLNDWLVEESIVPGSILSVGSYLAILACVSAGNGYAVVPKSVLDVIASNGEFRRHRLPKRYSRIKTLLVRRKNYSSSKLDALRAMLPRIPLTKRY
ncbi:MAG: LysR family transcriptional regulator [Hyphomicrobiaceae bacterium]